MTKQRMAHAAGEREDAALGSRLREAREYVGLKQEEVGRHLSIPRTAVSEMESGKRGVSALELKNLARLYQRPVGWFTGEEEAMALPADVAFLARTVSGLSDNDRAELQRFAEFLRAKGKVASDDAA
jgi:transcriptional regulator with XRE-family HTH domain